MAKPNALQAVLDRQARQAEPAPAVAQVAEVSTSKPYHRPSREGRRLIAGHFPPEVAKQLKLIAVEDGTTVQALLEEAITLLLVKKGRSIRV